MSRVDIAELRRLLGEMDLAGDGWISRSMLVADAIPALLDELEAAQEEVRRLTQAVGDLRKERDRAVKEAQRQDSVAKALRKDRDALAADNARLRAALDRAFEGAARQLAEPRHHGNDQYALTAIATTCEAALAATPAQSLAAHDAALLRAMAAKLDGEGHPANEYYRNWLMAEADRIEQEAQRG